MSGKGQAVVLKRRTPARLAKLMEEAVTVAYIIQPDQKPSQQMLSAKAGRLGVVIPEFEAWVEQASKLRGTGFARDQSLKALPVVTGGEVSWTGKQPKEAKMSAVKKITKKSEKTNEVAVMAVLAKRFKGSCKINGIEMLGVNRSRVWFRKPKTTKVVCAIVRTGKQPSVTFTKEQPEQPKKSKAKKQAKKSAKKTGRGKAVVVYFNSDNLKVLAAAKKFAKKSDESLASLVVKALTELLDL